MGGGEGRHTEVAMERWTHRRYKVGRRGNEAVSVPSSAVTHGACAAVSRARRVDFGEDRSWRSSAIMRRIDKRLVETKSGKRYKLVGKMDRERALELGEFLPTSVGGRHQETNFHLEVSRKCFNGRGHTRSKKYRTQKFCLRKIKNMSRYDTIISVSTSLLGHRKWVLPWLSGLLGGLSAGGGAKENNFETETTGYEFFCWGGGWSVATDTL